eukprot:gnl/TRDRNA2_/TRDRNA2_184142_c0_seq1.p1 gnl/TRDRNA2_/TRDRNA2_184142_c0~~gnl/TRDRNA2_/TRDRNA2_184142_c0_seq1.p1  ORF type:complete len:844 (+),score=110.49 gnl/TRDRNA2_/TRDRNA2_184142_c0_seq1:65-2533(+)
MAMTPVHMGHVQQPSFMHIASPAAVRGQSPSMRNVMTQPHQSPGAAALGVVLPVQQPATSSQQQYTAPSPLHTPLGAFPAVGDWLPHGIHRFPDGEMQSQAIVRQNSSPHQIRGPHTNSQEWWGGVGSGGASSRESSPYHPAGHGYGRSASARDLVASRYDRDRDYERDRSPRCDRDRDRDREYDREWAEPRQSRDRDREWVEQRQGATSPAASHTALRAQLRHAKKGMDTTKDMREGRTRRATSPVVSRDPIALEEGGVSTANTRGHSPREDRTFSDTRRGLSSSHTSSRTEIKAEFPRRMPQSSSLSAREADEAVALRNVRREVDDLRHENVRLQEKLGKARSLVLLLQKQADEARSERDRENRRSEGLQLSAQQLQRQLKREIARGQLLERHCTAAVKAQSQGSLSASSAAGAAAEVPAATEAVALDDEDGALVGNEAEITLTPKQADSPVGADELQQKGAGGPAGSIKATATDAQGLNVERSWEFVVQGQPDPTEQANFAPKLVSCFPDDAVERACSRGVACVCSRGRRLDNTVPNQDDFLLARHTLAHNGHIALYGVFDGHGPAGHNCAAFARSALPESLFGQHTLLMRPEDTLRHAFHQTQLGMRDQNFDTEHSGTTAALALVLNIPSPPGEQEARSSETWLFVAHVGDSRIILASRREDEPTAFTVTALTRDHRPDEPEEAERVRREGGEVRKLHRNSGAVRVFAGGQDRPALALTRTLGATGAAGCGVSAEPEVSAYRLRIGTDVLLMLGTDGLFEFCSNSDAVGKLLREGVSVGVLEEICGESRRQWAASSYNETVDDITAVAVSLPSSSTGS